MSAPRSDESSGVRVTFLGGLEIRGRGGALDAALVGPRAAAAVARLAAEPGGTVSRDELADAVWGERLPSSWRSALRNVVAGVRRKLVARGLEDEVALTSSGDGYRLTLAAGSSVDLVELRSGADLAERTLHDGDHVGAAQVARDALPLASLRVLPGVESDWADGLREEVADLRLRLERTAGEAALALADGVTAERHADRATELAPLRDDGCRLLMRARRATGNRAAALAAYDALRRRLADELGATPAPATEELFLEILAEEHEEQPPGGQPASRPAAAAGPLLLISRQTPFVGRQALLARLEARLEAARDGASGLVVLTGEPGAGKTRLAAQLAAHAYEAGTSVLYGRADDRVAVPYGPLLEALDGALTASGPGGLVARLGEHARVLAHLLPSLAAARDVAAPARAPDRLRLQQAIVASLRLVAFERPVLLILDDMQWASYAELALLEDLGREPAPFPLCALVLLRDGEHGVALGDGPDAERLALEPLTLEEVAALAGAIAGTDGEVDGRATHVRRLSGGNALLASELLRAAGEGGAPERPVRIDELVRGRLADLPADVEAVLRTAAVAGVEFDPALVAGAGDGEPARAAAALETARRAGLLVTATREPGWLGFRHALVRTSLLDRLEPGDRMRLHERLGSALEARPRREGAALVALAYHFGAAAPLGDWRRALRYGLPVARAARRAGVYEDVIAVATRTLAALERAGDPDPPARLDLEILLRGAQRALGDPAGPAGLRSAFEEAGAIGDPARMADAALAFSDAGALSDEAFVDDALVELYEQALDALGAAGPDRRAQLLGRLASAHSWRRGGAASRRAGEEALELAREVGADETLAGVLTTVRRSLSGTVELDRQERLERDLDALAERLDDPGLRVRTGQWRFDTAVERGRGDELEAILQTADEQARGLQMGGYHHSLAYARAALALLRGRLDDAEALVARTAAVGLERGVNPIVVEAVRLTQLMALRHEQGRLTELRDEAVAFFGPSGVPEWRCVPAFIDAEIGRLDGVGADVDAILDGFDAHGVTMTCSIGMLAHMAPPIARLGDAGRAERLQEMIAPFAGAGAYFAFFAGPIDFHLGLLARTLGREDEARARFGAAVAFAERLGAPRWRDRAAAELSAVP